MIACLRAEVARRRGPAVLHALSASCRSAGLDDHTGDLVSATSRRPAGHLLLRGGATSAGSSSRHTADQPGITCLAASASTRARVSRTGCPAAVDVHADERRRGLMGRPDCTATGGEPQADAPRELHAHGRSVCIRGSEQPWWVRRKIYGAVASIFFSGAAIARCGSRDSVAAVGLGGWPELEGWSACSTFRRNSPISPKFRK